MPTPDRKYLSEYALHLCSARRLMLPADQLHADGQMDALTAEISQACHIYVVCRRPVCSFDPETFSFDGQRTTGKLIYRIAGEIKEAPFELPLELLDGASSIRVSPYPHREVCTYDSIGDEVRYLPASVVSLSSVVSEQALRELKVLYVGQAYGDGDRAAIDRLRSHQTLQRILADTQSKQPDDEIMVLAFEFDDYRLITLFDGTDRKAIRGESDSQRFRSVLENPLTEHQRICLAEACLIRWFQPEYNKIYKSTFPASSQKILDECYQLDFSAIVTEIDTEELGVLLYSSSVAAGTHHIAKFDLVDPETRRSFFTLVGRDGRVLEMPGVVRRS